MYEKHVVPTPLSGIRVGKSRRSSCMTCKTVEVEHMVNTPQKGYPVDLWFYCLIMELIGKCYNV
jgi:hypothetical protein